MPRSLVCLLMLSLLLAGGGCRPPARSSVVRSPAPLSVQQDTTEAPTIRQDDVSIALLGVVKRPYSPEHLVIFARTVNQANAGNLQILPWSIVAEHQPAGPPRLTDSRGVTYKFTTSIGAEAAEGITLEPGKFWDEELIFERPGDGIEFLTLELPAANVGGMGVLTLKIPAAFITTQAPPTPGGMTPPPTPEEGSEP